MNRWAMLFLMGVMLVTVETTHWLRDEWLRGFRSNRRTIPGDAYGREDSSFRPWRVPPRRRLKSRPRLKNQDHRGKHT